jgi:hypothetical protein
MAASISKKRSFIAGATFSTGDLHKFVVLNANGEVVLPNTTGNVLPIGTLAGRTSTTSSTGSEAVPVEVEGRIKVRMAASTLAAGGYVGSSTAGLGIAPTSDAYTAGQIVQGSSGAVNRIHEVEFFRTGPLNTP